MAKSPEEQAQSMIDNLKANTGKTLAGWLKVVKAARHEKHGAIVKHLKTEHGMTHGYANLVAHKALAGSTPATGVDLIVVDHLSAFCRTGIENEGAAWLPVQSWLLSLRRRGLSVLLIHHAGKSGVQRGTSRREDVLDTTIALRRPKDYENEDGARFEVHFTKHRGFAGDDAAPIEAKLVTDGLGRSSWQHAKIGDKLAEQIRELNAEGLSVRQIASQLGVHKNKVQRRLKG